MPLKKTEPDFAEVLWDRPAPGGHPFPTFRVNIMKDGDKVCLTFAESQELRLLLRRVHKEFVQGVEDTIVVK